MNQIARTAEFPGLHFPATGARADAAAAGASITDRWPLELTARLRLFADARRTEPAAIVLAAFIIVLARYTGEERFAIACDLGSSGRRGRLNVDVGGDPSFEDVVLRCLAALAGAPNATDALYVGFMCGAGPGDVDELLFTVEEAHDGMSVKVAYRPALVTAAVAERLTRHVRTVLEAGVERGGPTAQLPLLTPAELAAFHADATTSARPITPDLYVHRRIAALASRNPSAIAITSERAELTYGELDRRANDLALVLRARGVRRGSVVAILLERSPELIVALVATLKAGGAYLPLDAASPRERLQFVIGAAAANVLITTAAMDADFALTVRDAVHLDAGASPHVHDSTELSDDVRGSNLAYVIFTSGSTGRPKGVMVSHAALANHLQWTVEADRLGARDSVLAHSPVTFDVSVWEMFAALASGARLVLSRPGGQYDVPYTLRLLAEQRIDVALFVPSVLGVLVRSVAFSRSASHLRLLVCAGEALPSDLAERVQFALPHTCIVNYYGPTEATVYATRMPVDSKAMAAPFVPIGRPGDNTTAYVVDRNLQPLPIGIAGELCIGGAGVALGYCGEPELTRRKFVPDPFGSEPGARLYRTGDIVRRNDDGAFAFLGRTDDLVKLRGIRIELGEVETVMRMHPALADCAVAVRGSAESARLVAYCVAADPAPISVEDLRRFAGEHLPEALIPSAFVALDALPRSTNGKLDRRALSLVDVPVTDLGIAPRTELEAWIARIWGDVLGRQRIGPHENFFDLGGTSLQGMRTMARLAAECSAELPLFALFDAPTVAELAARVDLLRRRNAPPPAVAPHRAPSEAPMSFGQEVLWLAQRSTPDSTAYNETLLFRLEGALDVPALARAVNGVVDDRAILRTAFCERAGMPMQRIAERAEVVLDLRDLRLVPDPQREARSVAVEIAGLPFDLGTAPLLRTFACRVGDSEWVLGFVFHHIVTDQWSMRLFLRDVSERYAASFGCGEPVTARCDSFADFAAGERGALDGAALERLIEHWSRILRDASATIALPAERIGEAVRECAAGSVVQIWPQWLADAARELSRHLETTTFVTLLAAFEAVLGRYADQPTVVVGVPNTGRQTAAAAGVMGYFTTVLPICAAVHAHTTFEELVRTVHRAALDATRHAAIPFERIARLMGHGSADGSRSPFQAVFNFDPFAANALELPGLAIAREPFENAEAKFDLFLNIAELPDGFEASVEYRRDRYRRETIEALLDNVRAFLVSALDDPKLPVQRVPMVSPAQRDRALAAGGEPVVETPALIHAAIAQRARHAPQNVAVSCDGVTLTYGDLDARAASLAAALRARNAGRGAFVVVFLERSIAAVVACLAVLKAGAAYLPIDPTDPAERIAFILGDASPCAILTSGRYRHLLGERAAGAIDVDGVVSVPAVEAASWFDASAQPDDPAYVIYTSGSTGRPKGVIVPHRGAANFIAHMQLQYPLSDRDAVLHWAALTFDASVWELFHTLGSGARLVVCKPGGNLDATYLAELVPHEGVTTLLGVPSVMRAMLETGVARAWTTVERVFLGAEAVTPDLIARLRAVLPGVRLTNLYGPTEASVCATAWDIPAEVPAVVPIGAPITAVRAYVLSAHGDLQPAGVPGELVIGGAGVAAGYLNREELTRERFVADPFVPGGRTYRSGDRVRRRADGTLDFLGRLDAQVKLHGIRIELGEVESALRSLAGIVDAVCTITGNDGSEPRLVAYVVFASPGFLEASEIRARLVPMLPTICLPAAFVPIPAIPLTTSGKIDRSALPPLQPDAGRSPDVAPPLTGTERMVSNVVSAILGRTRLDRHDDFFASGGDSLSAMRAAVRLEAVCGVMCSVRMMFDGRTVAGIAALIDAQAPPVDTDADELDALLHALSEISDEEAARLTSEKREHRDR